MSDELTKAIGEFQTGLDESTDATKDLTAKLTELPTKRLSPTDFAGHRNKDGVDSGGTLHVEQGARVRPDEFTGSVNTPSPMVKYFQDTITRGDYDGAVRALNMKSIPAQIRKRAGIPDGVPMDIMAKELGSKGLGEVLSLIDNAMTDLEGAQLKRAEDLRKQILMAKVTAERASIPKIPEIKTPETKIVPTPKGRANMSKVIAVAQDNMLVTDSTGKQSTVPVIVPTADKRIKDVRKIFRPMTDMDTGLARATTNMLKYTVGGAEQRGSDYFHQPEVRLPGGLLKHEGVGLVRFDHIRSGKRAPSGEIEPEIAKDFAAIVKETGLPEKTVADMVKSVFSVHDIAKYPGGNYDPEHGAKMFNVVSPNAAKNYVSTLYGMGGDDPTKRAQSRKLAQELLLGNLMHHYSTDPEKGLGLYDETGNLSIMGRIAQEYGSSLGFKTPEETMKYIQSRPGARLPQNIDRLAASTTPAEYTSYMGGENGVARQIEDAAGLTALGLDSATYRARIGESYRKLITGESMTPDELALARKAGMTGVIRAMAYHSSDNPTASQDDLDLAAALGVGKINSENITPELALIRNKGKIGAAKYRLANVPGKAGEQLATPGNQADWFRSIAGLELSPEDFEDPKILTSLFGPEVMKAAYLTGFRTNDRGQARSTFFANMHASVDRFAQDGTFSLEEAAALKKNIGRANAGFTKMVQGIEGTAAETVEAGKVFQTINQSAEKTAVARMDIVAKAEAAERHNVSTDTRSRAAGGKGATAPPTKSTDPNDYAMRLATIGSSRSDLGKVAEAKELLQLQKLALENKANEINLETKQKMALEDRIALEKVQIQQGQKAEAQANQIALKTAERMKLMVDHPELYDATLQAEANQKINNAEKTQLTNQLLQERINLINQIKASSMSEEEKIKRINDLLVTGNKTIKERNQLQMEGRDYMGMIGGKELNYGALGLGTPKDKGGGVWGKAANFLGTNPFQLKQNAFLVGSVFGAGATSAWAMLRQATDQLKQAELAAINLGRVFNGTSADLKALQKEALTMSVQYGQSVQDIGKIQEEWAKTGKESYSEISQLTEATVLALNTSNFESAEKATKSLNSAITQMGIGADKVINLLDSWNAVADAFPADTQDLAEAYERSGSYAKSVGLDTDELNALAVTIMERTGRSGAEAGTAMRAIFSNVFKAKSVKTMEDMGIQVYQRDEEGNIDESRYRDFVDILRDAGAKYSELNASGKTVEMVELANALGQARQRNFAIAAMEGMATFDEKVDISRESSGYSQEKLDKTMESWDKKAAQLGAALQAATVAIADTGLLDAIKALTDGLTGLFKWVSSNEGIMENYGVQIRTVIADLIGMAVVLRLVNKSFVKRTTMKAPEFLADKILGRASGKGTAKSIAKNIPGAQGIGTEILAAGTSKAFKRGLVGGLTDVKDVNKHIGLYKAQENFYNSIAGKDKAMAGDTDAIKAYTKAMMAKQAVDVANVAIMDESIAKTIAKGLSTEANTALESIYSLNMESQIALTNVLAQSENTEAAMTLEQMAAESANIQAQEISAALTALQNLNDEERAAVLAILNASLGTNNTLTAANTEFIKANTVAQMAAKKASMYWTIGITAGIVALTALIAALRSASKQAEELAGTRIKVHLEHIEETKQAQTSSLSYTQAKNKRDAIKASIEAKNKQSGAKSGDPGYIEYRADAEWKEYNKQTQDAAIALYGYIPGASTGGTYVDGIYVPDFDDDTKIDEELAKRVETERETTEYMQQYWGERLRLDDKNLDGWAAWNDMVRYSPAGVQALIDMGNKSDAIDLIKGAYIDVYDGMNYTTQNPYEVYLNQKYGMGSDKTDKMWLEAFSDAGTLEIVRKSQAYGKLYLPKSTTLPRKAWLNYIKAADQEETSGGLKKYIDNLSMWSKPWGQIDYFDSKGAQEAYDNMISSLQASAVAPNDLMTYMGQKYGFTALDQFFDTFSPNKVKVLISDLSDMGTLTLRLDTEGSDLQDMVDSTTTGFHVNIDPESNAEFLETLKTHKEKLEALNGGVKLDLEPTGSTKEVFLTLDQIKALTAEGYTIPITLTVSKTFAKMYAEGEIDPDSAIAAGAADRVKALDVGRPDSLVDKTPIEAPISLEDYRARSEEYQQRAFTIAHDKLDGTYWEEFFTGDVTDEDGWIPWDDFVDIVHETFPETENKSNRTFFAYLAKRMNDQSKVGNDRERLFKAIDRYNEGKIQEHNKRVEPEKKKREEQMKITGLGVIDSSTDVAERMTNVSEYSGKADDALGKLTSLSKRLTKGTAGATDLEKFFTTKVTGADGFMESAALVSVLKDLGYLKTDKLEDTDWKKLANDAKGHQNQGEKLFTKIFEAADEVNRAELSEQNDLLQEQLQAYIDAIAGEKTAIQDRLAQINEKLKTEGLSDKVKNSLEVEKSKLETDLAVIDDKLTGYTGALGALRTGETALTTTDSYDPDFKDPVTEFGEYVDKASKGLARFDNAVDKAMHALEKFDALNQFSSLDPKVVAERRKYVEQANAEAGARISEREDLIRKLQDWQPGAQVTLPDPYTGVYQPATTYPDTKEQIGLGTNWSTKYDNLIKAAALKYGVDANLVKAMIRQESPDFDPEAVSHAGAVGLMQVVPKWHNTTKTDMMDPEKNIYKGTAYIKELIDRYGGDWELALAAYNAGPGALDAAGKNISKLSKETREYVPKVLANYETLVSSAAAAMPPTTVAEKVLNPLSALLNGVFSTKEDNKDGEPGLVAKLMGNLASWAKSKVGYQTPGGTTNEANPFTEAMGSSEARAWCADFVSAGLKKVFNDEGYVAPAGSASVMGLLNQVIFHSKDTYAPKVGDLAFFQYDDDAAYDHVELVVSVDEAGNVTTVGGNTTGGKVKESVNKQGIVGYGSYTDTWTPMDEYERAQAIWDSESANRQDEMDSINRTMEQRQLEHQARIEVINRNLYTTERVRAQYSAIYGDMTDTESYRAQMNSAIDADIANRQDQIDSLYNELLVSGDAYDWLPEIQQQIDDLNNSIYELQWEKLNNDLAVFSRRLQDIEESVSRLNTKLQIDTSIMARKVTKADEISGGLTREQYDQYYNNKDTWNWANQERLKYADYAAVYEDEMVYLQSLLDAEDSSEGLKAWAEAEMATYKSAMNEYEYLTGLMTTANQANIAIRDIASSNLGYQVGEAWEAEVLGAVQALKAENILVDNTVAKAQVTMKGYNDILWQTRQSQVELTSEIADLESRLAAAIASDNTQAKIESLARTLQDKKALLQEAVLDEAKTHEDILGYLTDLTKYGYQEALEAETERIEADIEAERKRHEEWIKNRQEEQDLLKRRWEDEDQAKKIAEIDEDIAELEEKKANLDGDTSQYAAKLRKDYQDKIDELKKQKADAQLQYERNLQQRAYDDELKDENEAYDDFNEAKQDQKKAVQDHYESLIETADAYVNGLYEAFGRSPQLTLNKLTELVPEITQAGYDAAEAYTEAFRAGLSLNTHTSRLDADKFGIDESMLDTIPREAQRQLIENSVDWLNLYMQGTSPDSPILQALTKSSQSIRSEYGLDSSWLPKSLTDYRKILLDNGTVANLQDQAYMTNSQGYLTQDGITSKQANLMVSNSDLWSKLQSEANELTANGTLSIEQLDEDAQARLREIKNSQDILHQSNDAIRLQAKAFYESTGRVLENLDTWMPTTDAPYIAPVKGESTTIVSEYPGNKSEGKSHGLTASQVDKYNQNKEDWWTWEAERLALYASDNEYRWLQSLIDSAESTEGEKAWARLEQEKYAADEKRYQELLALQKAANLENIKLRNIASLNLGQVLDDTWIPTFGDGGLVDSDGLAFVHKREMVLPETYANAIDFIAETLTTPRMTSVSNPKGTAETKVEVREAIHIEHAQFNDELDLDLIEKRAGAKLKADLRSKGIR